MILPSRGWGGKWFQTITAKCLPQLNRAIISPFFFPFAVFVCVWEDGTGQKHWGNGSEGRFGKKMHRSWWAVSHLVRCLALEAANIQWSDEGHILKAVLHAHRFGAFVLQITPQFHHLQPLVFLYFPEAYFWKEEVLHLYSLSGQWKLANAGWLMGTIFNETVNKNVELSGV